MSQERHVVVTGGTGALGTAVVARLVEAGAHCHVTWVEPRERDRFGIRQGAELHHVDCSDEAAVVDFYAALPGLDASVHLVGGFAMAPLTETRAEDFEAMFRLNALSAFLCCREAARRMGEGGGRIVNVAAKPVLAPTGGMVAYSTAKAAVASLTRCLAEELRPQNVLVNAVVPSIMDTPQNRAAMPDADFERWPKVEQVAEAIGFLAGPENQLTSGVLLPVFGRS